MIDIGKPTQCMICPPDAAGTCNRNHNRTEHQSSMLFNPPADEVVEYNYPEQPLTPQEQLLDEDEEDDEEEEYNGPAGTPVLIMWVFALAFVAAIVVTLVVGVTFSDNLEFMNLYQLQSDYASTQ